ncbi:MAG: DNA recombination protein RmuC [Bacteroidaceae bacterium]
MVLVLSIIIAMITAIAGYFVGHYKVARRAEQEQAILREKIIALQTRLDSERDAHEQAIKSERNLLHSEFRTMTQEFATKQSDALRATNREQIDTLLSPLTVDIRNFKASFAEGQTLMKHSIKDLLERTLDLGKEAAELTRALKADPKKQGNWGEAVLLNLLETSGLTEGRDFVVQEHETSSDGQTFIPDVVVHFPGKRSVIIDSKVSLTAFTNYMTAEKEVERVEWLKEHLLSVRKHVKELSDKDYASVVPNSIGYVLMFIPNEGSYITAVENDPQIVTEAYAHHIILLNPTNLLMALQLAYNLWQSEKQARNVQSIYEDADKLYTKFVRFAKTFTEIGTSIRKLDENFLKAEKQLSSGRGNVIRQLENWKEKGLHTSSSIPENLLEQDDNTNEWSE